MREARQRVSVTSTDLRISAAELPIGWSAEESDGDGVGTEASTGERAVHAHAHLAASVALWRADDGADRVLAGDGERRRRLHPPEAPTDPGEATDWAVALMRQIDRQCGPDCRNPVGAALRRVRGKPAREPAGRGSERGAEADRERERTCLLCGATLAPFRGEDTAARFASHVRYADDATHADAARYLADPTTYAGRSVAADSPG